MKYTSLILSIFLLVNLFACQEEQERLKLGIRIETITPDSGIAGTEITIRGQGFSEIATENIIMIGGIRVESISAKPDEIITQIPEELQMVDDPIECVDVEIPRPGFEPFSRQFCVLEFPNPIVTHT